MLHPVVVHHAQHDDLLELSHILLTEELLTLLIAFVCNLLKCLLEFVAAELF